MGVYLIFLGVAVLADVVGILWEFHAEQVLSPSTADIIAPFTLSIVATVLVLVGSVGVMPKLAVRSRLWLVLSCFAFFVAIPLAMRVAGVGMNVHGWTFYAVWPMIQSLLVVVISLLFILISAIRGRLVTHSENNK